MLNIGFTEFLAIGVIALLVIGPKQLPEVARIVGRLIGELKKASKDLSGGLLEVTQEMKDSINETREQIINEGRQIADSLTNFEPQDSSKEEPEKIEFARSEVEKFHDSKDQKIKDASQENPDEQS